LRRAKGTPLEHTLTVVTRMNILKEQRFLNKLSNQC
jgi:hypothetical protein